MTKHPGTSSAFRIAGDMQKRLATLEASEGVKSVGQHEGGSLRAEGVVLTGYNGEAIRSFYSHRVEQVSPGEFSADAYMRAVWPEALWSPDSGWATLRSSRRSAARWTEMSVRRETPASRPRRSAIISTSRPATDTSPGIRRWSQPLSRSVHAAVLPRRWSGWPCPCPLADRVTGRITFDLFRLLAPKALEVPFDSMKFSGEVRAEWEQLPLKKLSEVPEAVYDRRTPPPPRPPRRRSAGWPYQRSPQRTSLVLERSPVSPRPISRVRSCTGGSCAISPAGRSPPPFWTHSTLSDCGC